jgi:hypothetical protein
MTNRCYAKRGLSTSSATPNSKTTSPRSTAGTPTPDKYLRPATKQIVPPMNEFHHLSAMAQPTCRLGVAHG